MRRLVIFCSALGTYLATACVVPQQQPQPVYGQAAPAPAPNQTAPAPGAPDASVQEDVVARGQFGTLTQDNALAFYEALVFSLQAVGQAQLATQINQQQFLVAVAQHYPQGDAEVQQNLANARQLWNQVKMSWPQMNQDQQREFVFEVLVLGIGGQAAAQLTGLGGQRGGTSAGANSRSGYSGSADVGYEGSDCWAAAGCADYDSSSGTYTMEEPPMPSGDY